MQSILPIFDKSGDLKFYTFSKNDKGYSFKDVGEGYSWFGDATAIQGTSERAGLKALMTDYVEKTINNTGLSPQEVKDMWNLRMLELTGMGGRMYYGQDITSRFSNGLWGTQAAGDAPDITDEQANELLGYILEGKGVVPVTSIKNSIYPQGTRAVVDEKNNTVYLEAPQGSSTELKAPADGVLSATSTSGVFMFEEDGTKEKWTISNVLAGSLGHYTKGDTIAFKDTNNMLGVTIGSSSSKNIVDRLAATAKDPSESSRAIKAEDILEGSYKAGGMLVGAGKEVLDGVTTAGGMLVGAGKEVIEGLSTAGDMLVGAGKDILEAVSAAGDSLPDAARGAAKGVNEAGKEVLEGVSTAGNMIPNAAKEVAKGVEEAGKGVLEGVSSAGSMLYDAAKEVAKGVDDAIEILKDPVAAVRKR